MTQEEKIIVSAYTGFLICDNFSNVHEYVEKVLGRPVWTHEFANERLQEEIRKAVKPDLARICNWTKADGKKDV